MIRKEIGIVTLTLNAITNVVIKAKFVPTMEVQATKKLLNQLRQCKAEKDLKSAAQMVFSEWFVHTNEIELTSRLEYKIEIEEMSNVVNVGEREVTFKFYFQQLQEASLN